MKKVLFLLVAAAGAAVGFAVWRRRSAANADIWSELDGASFTAPTPAAPAVVEPVVADVPEPKAPRKRTKAAEAPSP